MKFTRLSIPDLILIEPDIFTDSRGLFFEVYHKEKYEKGGIRLDFLQHNQSESKKGVLRGLHLQLKKPQGKLVRVLSGEAFDVAVDVRVGSPTFKKWVSLILSSDNHNQLYIPPGFAHGFVALSDYVVFEYKCTDFYDKSDEGSIHWADPDLAIDWPINSPFLSEKDQIAPLLQQQMNVLPKYNQ